MANQTNEDLVDNLLPIWTGRELEKKEIIEVLEERKNLYGCKQKDNYTKHENPPRIWIPL